jgi:hypothetical protein
MFWRAGASKGSGNLFIDFDEIKDVDAVPGFGVKLEGLVNPHPLAPAQVIFGRDCHLACAAGAKGRVENVE